MQQLLNGSLVFSSIRKNARIRLDNRRGGDGGQRTATTGRRERRGEIRIFYIRTINLRRSLIYLQGQRRNPEEFVTCVPTGRERPIGLHRQRQKTGPTLLGKTYTPSQTSFISNE